MNNGIDKHLVSLTLYLSKDTVAARIVEIYMQQGGEKRACRVTAMVHILQYLFYLEAKFDLILKAVHVHGVGKIG